MNNEAETSESKSPTGLPGVLRLATQRADI